MVRAWLQARGVAAGQGRLALPLPAPGLSRGHRSVCMQCLGEAEEAGSFAAVEACFPSVEKRSYGSTTATLRSGPHRRRCTPAGGPPRVRRRRGPAAKGMDALGRIVAAVVGTLALGRDSPAARHSRTSLLLDLQRAVHAGLVVAGHVA